MRALKAAVILVGVVALNAALAAEPVVVVEKPVVVPAKQERAQASVRVQKPSREQLLERAGWQG